MAQDTILGTDTVKAALLTKINNDIAELFTTRSVAMGGTGATTLTDHGILLGSGTGAVTALGAATNGQIPVGSTGADPVLAVITAGEGIDITNGAGSIEIACEETSETNKGVVELATNAETVTGTDTTRAVTPDGLTDKMAAPGAIGGTTPAAGAFTTLSASGVFSASDNIEQANGKYLSTDEVRARDGSGLALKDDGGNLGILITDGGSITNIGPASTVSSRLSIGGNASGEGNRYAYIDLIGDDVNPYGMRVLRKNTGENADSQILHNGTGKLQFIVIGAGSLEFKTQNVARLTIDSSGHLNVASGYRVYVDEIWATDSGGLNLRDDGGNIGLTLADGGVITIGSLTLSNPLTVPNGGLGVGTLTDHGILVGSGTGAITPLAVMTDGQLAIGATGADPAPQTVSGDATLATGGALTLASDIKIKGWINLNGTGTIAINDSYNVTSITDNGTGNYTITWDTNFADEHYAVAGLVETNDGSQPRAVYLPVGGKAAGTLDIYTGDTPSANLRDLVDISIFAIGAQ